MSDLFDTAIAAERRAAALSLGVVAAILVASVAASWLVPEKKEMTSD